jgi:hypothetical protein
MGEKRNACRILVGKPEGKRLLGRKISLSRALFTLPPMCPERFWGPFSILSCVYRR